jgi:hypothetical protein
LRKLWMVKTKSSVSINLNCYRQSQKAASDLKLIKIDFQLRMFSLKSYILPSEPKTRLDDISC